MGFNLNKQNGLCSRGSPPEKWVLALPTKSQQENGPCCWKRPEEKGAPMLRGEFRRKTDCFVEKNSRITGFSTFQCCGASPKRTKKKVFLLHFRVGELGEKEGSLKKNRDCEKSLYGKRTSFLFWGGSKKEGSFNAAEGILTKRGLFR